MQERSNIRIKNREFSKSMLANITSNSEITKINFNLFSLHFLNWLNVYSSLLLLQKGRIICYSIVFIVWRTVTTRVVTTYPRPHKRIAGKLLKLKI